MVGRGRGGASQRRLFEIIRSRHIRYFSVGTTRSPHWEGRGQQRGSGAGVLPQVFLLRLRCYMGGGGGGGVLPTAASLSMETCSYWVTAESYLISPA